MSRDSKRKLAIVAGISECLVYAEAKYCAFEIHGEPKYYVCPRAEYCCNFGCCVSPGFQIYHLWYYWLLVIIMFLVCSGGGWWYRYWLQGRYRAAASAIPSRGTGSSRGQNAHRGPVCPAQQASITYNSARNTVLLHRMWKAAGPHRGPTSSPAYTGPAMAAAASSTHFQNTSVVLNDVNCPYYQLYGPPPSYETVIAQTRGKLSSPLSPEHSRSVNGSSATGSSTLPNQDIATRCWNHSPYNHPSQPGNLTSVDSAISRYEGSSFEATSGFSRYAPSCANNGAVTTPVHTAGRQDACLPLNYHGGPISPLDYRDDHASIVPDTYRIYHTSTNLERLPSYHGERSSLDRKTRRINETSESSTSRQSSQVLTSESHSSVPDLKIEGGDIYARRAKTPQEDQRYSRNHGGSLKFSRTHEESGNFRRKNFLAEIGAACPSSWRNEAIAGNSSETTLSRIIKSGNPGMASDTETTNFRKATNFGESDESGFSRSTRNGLLSGDKGRANVTTTSTTINRCFGIEKQTNPSDNVILEPLTSVNIIDSEGATASSFNDDLISSSACWRTTRRNNEQDEKRRRRVPSPGARGTTNDNDKVFVEFTINNHESKHNKLDRSKSLD